MSPSPAPAAVSFRIIDTGLNSSAAVYVTLPRPGPVVGAGASTNAAIAAAALPSVVTGFCPVIAAWVRNAADRNISEIDHLRIFIRSLSFPFRRPAEPPAEGTGAGRPGDVGSRALRRARFVEPP